MEETMEPQADPEREFLRHTVATLAYRAEKVLRDVPSGIVNLRIAGSTRSAAEILAHMGDLMEWALWLAKGKHVWHDSTPGRWDDEVSRFFRSLRLLDEFLASELKPGAAPGKLFQGPVADALTHVGQIALIRGVAGTPVRSENYFRADIVPGRVGTDQSGQRVEF
jgi:hypothetical protein